MILMASFREMAGANDGVGEVGVPSLSGTSNLRLALSCTILRAGPD